FQVLPPLSHRNLLPLDCVEEDSGHKKNGISFSQQGEPVRDATRERRGLYRSFPLFPPVLPQFVSWFSQPLLQFWLGGYVHLKPACAKPTVQSPFLQDQK